MPLLYQCMKYHTLFYTARTVKIIYYVLDFVVYIFACFILKSGFVQPRPFFEKEDQMLLIEHNHIASVFPPTLPEPKRRVYLLYGSQELSKTTCGSSYVSPLLINHYRWTVYDNICPRYVQFSILLCSDYFSYRLQYPGGGVSIPFYKVQLI